MGHPVVLSWPPRRRRLLAAPASLATAAFVLLAATAGARDEEARRLAACEEVVKALIGGPESIPRDLLDKAQCVTVIPDAKKLALGVGGRFGRGAVVCRSADGIGWRAPFMITMGGGSVGWQIGGQEADYVFLIMNPKGVEHLMKSQFSLGADAAVAAGPVGRSGTAATDATLRAEILSYSRTRGIFAGLSLEGAVIKQDKDGNEKLFGRPVDPRRLLLGDGYAVPAEAKGLVQVLTESSPRHAARN